MTIYEVNIDLDPDIQDTYREWLTPHIREILKFEGFLEASVFTRESDNEKIGLTVHYRARNRAAVEGYLENHSARFRKDASDRFGGRFSAKRRILEESESVRAGS